MTASEGVVVMVVVSEQTEAVSKPDAQEQSWPSLGAILAETSPVITHVRVVPEPNSCLSVVVSPNILAVNSRVELHHVSHSDTPRISGESGPEAGEGCATNGNQKDYFHLMRFSGTDPLCLRPSSLSMLKSKR